MCKKCSQNNNELWVLAGGFLFCFCLYWLFNGCEFIKDCREAINANYTDPLEFIINRYQTLITGIIALYVGFITVRVVREQIASESEYREKEQQERLAGKTLVFQKTLEHYLKRIRTVVRLWAWRSKAVQGNIPIHITFPQREWDYLPKEPHKILMDWNYFSDLAKADIEAYVEIRQSVEQIITYIETLRPQATATGHTILTQRYLTFSRYFAEEENKILAHLAKLSCFQK